MKYWLLGSFLALTACGFGLEPLPGPAVTATSAIIIDAETGTVLWQHNPDLALYPASTTKILTSLLLLENRKLDDSIVGPPGVDKVTGSSLHMKPGEVISVRDALYAMLLRSANDVCYAVAIDLAGSVEKFADMMNAKAQEIGATHSHFHNPNGLNDPLHKTTARDLAVIARFAMRNETFQEIVKTKKYTVTRSLNTLDRLIENRNTYLKLDTTADGIKTGFTEDAGHCYVGSVTRDGVRIITVVLKSKDWLPDHQNMVNWTYGHYQVGLAKSKGEPLCVAPVANGVANEISVVANEDVRIMNRRDATTPLDIRWEGKPIVAPVKAGTVVGQVAIVNADGKTFHVSVVAGESVSARSPLAGVKTSGIFAVVGGAALLTGAWMMRRRPRY